MTGPEKSQLVFGLHLVVAAALVALGGVLYLDGSVLGAATNVGIGVVIGLVGYRISKTL